MLTQPNTDYVKRRESLIPEAERYANLNAGPRPPYGKDHKEDLDTWRDVWNRLFHTRMDHLAKAS